jgi:hypothetical protein
MTDQEHPKPELIHAEIINETEESGERLPTPADRLTRLAESVAFLGGVIYRIYRAFSRSPKDTSGQEDGKCSPPGRQRRIRRGQRPSEKKE